MTETFADFHFQPFLMEALKDLHFVKPTPVQEKVIPIVLANKSVVGQSQTGSGKTHAFLLPIFEQLDAQNQNVQVVITTPSRELAYQIYNAAKQLNRFAPQKFTIHNYVGGTDKQHQIDQLQRKQPQLVIGTPGRILDLINSQALDIHTAHRDILRRRVLEAEQMTPCALELAVAPGEIIDRIALIRLHGRERGMMQLHLQVLHVDAVYIRRIAADIAAGIAHIDRQHGPLHTLDPVAIGIEIRHASPAQRIGLEPVRPAQVRAVHDVVQAVYMVDAARHLAAAGHAAVPIAEDIVLDDDVRRGHTHAAPVIITTLFMPSACSSLTTCFASSRRGSSMQSTAASVPPTARYRCEY